MSFATKACWTKKNASSMRRSLWPKAAGRKSDQRSATSRSVAFYSRLGLTRTASSLNVSREREKLDNLLGAVVEVTTLAFPMQAVPHVELLCYRGNFDRRELSTNRNDVVATQLVFKVEPDGLDEIVAPSHDTTISSLTTVESAGLRALLRDLYRVR
jgi:hypothetical protein